MNKIHVSSQLLEDIILEDYALVLPKYLGMFVKQDNKATLVETFEEAIKVEKNALTHEPKRSGKIDTFPHKRNEMSSKTIS